MTIIKEKSAPLEALFGDSARVSIIGAFVAERGRELSVSEVARLAEVSRSTVYRHIDDLLALGVVEHTRDGDAGHSPRYTLADTQVGELCWKLEGVALKTLLEKEGEL
jgi:DNA-binding transcriptional ArsR family regulator